MKPLTIHIGNLDETGRVGRRLGALLRPGHVIALIGPLGSGKTALVKSVADGAGVQDLRQVNSPTFVIVNEYDAEQAGSPLHIYHIDAYRLRGGGDLDALGFDEMCTLGAVLIEWADRVEHVLPDDRLTILIRPGDGEQRRFDCHAGGPLAGALLRQLSPSDTLPELS